MSPNDIITYSQKTSGGKTFKCSRRTAAHLDSTKAALTKAHPKAKLVIIQGCYHTGYKLSAGTHDFDACLDVRVEGLGWWDSQKFLRQQGWGAYYRHTGSWAKSSAWHIHMFSLPPNRKYATRVGEFVDGGVSHGGVKYTSSQLDDYYNHSLGLKGQHRSGLDTSWFPANIKSTIFNYDAWIKKDEDEMTPKERADLVQETADAVWGRIANGQNSNMGTLVVGGNKQITSVAAALKANTDFQHASAVKIQEYINASTDREVTTEELVKIMQETAADEEDK